MYLYKNTVQFVIKNVLHYVYPPLILKLSIYMQLDLIMII